MSFLHRNLLPRSPARRPATAESGLPSGGRA